MGIQKELIATWHQSENSFFDYCYIKVYDANQRAIEI